MALTLARWPLAFAARTPANGVRPDRLLRANPVLLLPGLQSSESVAKAVAVWNPAADASGDGGLVADGVRWHGPIRLTPMMRADAALPTAGEAGSCGIAYVAEVKRERVKVADSRQAELVRSRYPRGVPVGAEAEAWQLVRGLAKRLRGVAHLPGCPPYAPHSDPSPLLSDSDHRVFSHEMLPWIVLREILRPLAPELSREALPDGGGYVLRQRGLVEVRVRPADRSTPVPGAIRDRVDDAWPHSVYEFRDIAEESAPAGFAQGSREELRNASRDGSQTLPRRAPRQTRTQPWSPSRTTAASRVLLNAASLIAEVTGGVLLDTDGFPVAIRATAARWP